MKKIVRRALADADILASVDYYMTNAPEHVFGLIDAIEQAVQHIQQFPASGSTRYGYELELPDLRVWQCNQYPYLVFYIEYTAQIEILRVLHTKRDIPHSFQQES